MLSLQQLRTPVTVDEATTFLIGKLAQAGFNARSWQPGSKQRALVSAFARAYSSFSEIVRDVTDLGFNETATGDALTAYSLSNYDNRRFAARATEGTMVLANSGLVPHTVVVGQLVVARGDKRFRNTTAGSVSPGGGTLTLSWKAESAGAAWNIPTSTTDLVLATPLAGVTVTNPPIDGSDTWVTVTGTDQESDPELRERNQTKWASLSLELVRDGYVNVARNADEAIRRVGVADNNPRGSGTIDVYIAGSDSTSSVDEQEAAQNAFAARVWYTDEYPANAGTTRCLVRRSEALPLSLAGTIYYSAAFTAAAAQSAVEEALRAFLRTIPLGGFDFGPVGPAAIVPKNDLEFAIKGATINGQPVVRTVQLTTPSSDLEVPSFNVVTEGDWTGLTYRAVQSA
jgi:uncharacterized phage protein gp47/JayE